MRRVLLIANPISGSGRNRARAEALALALGNVSIRAEIAFTERRGHAVELAANAAAEGFESAVAVGGDGTLREVAEGAAARIPVGVCPSGTANVVARELMIPFTIDSIADIIKNGIAAPIDTAICNDRRVLFVIGAGFDAEILNELEKVRRGGISYRSYIKPIFNVLKRYQPARLRVSVDGAAARDCTFVIISNTRYYAGPWVRFARGPALNDGVFETYLFHCESVGSLALAAMRGLAGKLPGGSVECVAGRKIEIESLESTPIQIDGDAAGAAPASVVVEPRSLPILVSRNSPLAAAK
ncbi:MAG: diacylglycerol/lipid kinase family protein [Planctomycetota bacterium]